MLYQGLPGVVALPRRQGLVAWILLCFRRLRRNMRGLNLFLGVTVLMGVATYTYARRTGRSFPSALLKVGDYVPSSITSALNPQIGLELLGWEDEPNGRNSSTNIIKKPKFHLLLPNPARSGAQLCKTILTAAILNYPPPTLINGRDRNRRDGSDDNELVKGVFEFLMGKEVKDDDLVLIVDEDMWFQLPAEVTLHRFLRSSRDSNALLMQMYGTDSPVNVHSSVVPKFTEKVLFGAQKKCAPNSEHDPACFSVPVSRLPTDIYGAETDKRASKHFRPRYMHSAVAMGKVKDLRLIYKAACEILEFSPKGQFGRQYVFAQLFGEQEYHRSEYLKQIKGTRFNWLRWFAEKIGIQATAKHDVAFMSKNLTEPEKSYEYGIGVDYNSSIFQVMDNSEEDVRFVTFDQPNIIAASSRKAKARFHYPIRLPLDLNITKGPFGLHRLPESLSQQNPPLVPDLDTIPYNKHWTDLYLATNVIVPGSTTPTTLNFHGVEELMDEWWDKMWFHNASRALLRQVHRSPVQGIASESAYGRTEKWWDVRGGRGGAWTDSGEWLEWTDVCGHASEAIFGDGRGEPNSGQDDPESGQMRLIHRKSSLLHRLPRTKESNRLRRWMIDHQSASDYKIGRASAPGPNDGNAARENKVDGTGTND